MTFTRIALVVLLVLALTGAVLSYALLLRGANPGQDTGWASRACGGADEYACDRVLQSRYAVIGKYPSALVGLMYFVFLGVWYLTVGRPNHTGRYWHLVPLVVGAVGSAGSVYFTYVMMSVLRTVCPLCLATHVVNWVMLAVGLALWPRQAKQPTSPTAGIRPPAPAATPHWRYAVVSLALSLAAAQLMNAWYGRAFWAHRYRLAEHELRRIGSDPELIRMRFERQAVQQFNIRPDDPVRGPADAAHTVVVFSDFQCRQCKDFADFFRKTVEADETVSVRVVFKHYPMNRTCNKEARTTLHAYACDAARAAEAARRIGGNEAFWRMHDLLFRRQRQLDLGRYRELAAGANVDAEALIEKMDDPDVQSWIAGDTLQARLVGVKSTPAVFHDGRYVERWGSEAFWKTALSPAPATQPKQVVDER